MVVTNNVPLRRTDLRSASQIAVPQHLSVANAPIDIKVTPVGKRIGSKRPVTIDLLPGGNGANGGQVAVVNEIGCGALAVQGEGEIAALARRLLEDRGLQPFIIERSGVREALTVALPNGKPGAYHLEVQRMAPMTVSEFVRFRSMAVSPPDTLFLGPMPKNEESLAFHIEVARFAPRRAIMVHPSMLRELPLFQEVGRLYQFVQMNYAEAAQLDPAAGDIEELACRVRYLLGERVDFAITNGAKDGLVWCDYRWWKISPQQVTRVKSDVGAGDVFGSAFCLARWYFHASPRAAVHYACRSSENWLAGRALQPYKAPSDIDS